MRNNRAVAVESYRVLGPLLRALPPETSHRLAIRALSTEKMPAARPARKAILQTEVCGLGFENPIGLAAGFDKNGEAIGPLLQLGFAFVEIGTVTPRAQAGNPRPRLFRLRRERAVINRLGFNSEGAEAVAERVGAFRRKGAAGGAVGINIGANRDSADPVADYGTAAEVLGPLADYVAVNVSSPNTPGLRDLQEEDALAHIVSGVRAGLARGARRAGDADRPVFVKLSPDRSERDLATSARAAARAGASGLIATNTTAERPHGLRGRHRRERGGLSGPPLFETSTRAIAIAYRATGGTLPIVGAGGIDGADAAYAKIRAGASLVQLYTGLIYRGPALPAEIARGLAARLRADGFARVGDAVGADARSP